MCSGIELDESDHNWIGNWWFGFLISSFFSLIAVLPILSFPKVLPAAVDIQRSRLQACRRRSSLRHQNLPTSESRDSIDEKLEEIVEFNPATNGQENFRRVPRKSVDAEEKTLLQKAWRDIKHIPAAVSRLLLNPCYMFINLAAAVDGRNFC